MNKRVLVVDDDVSVRESLKRILEETGYEVIVAADGKEAEGQWDDPQIELLILDLHMPNRSGWEVLKEVSEERPLLPVIIITGSPIDSENSIRFPGITTLVRKPIEVEELLSTVEGLLEESKESRFLRLIQSSGIEARSDSRQGRSSGGVITVSFSRPSRIKQSGDVFAE